MTIAPEIALSVLEAGFAVVPPRNDGSKAPASTWRQYEHQPPDASTVAAWYASGRDGIGVVCGTASGNLEMLELEGRAVEAGMFDQLFERAAAHGLDELLGRITDAYMERSPSGGVHLLYRVTDGALGNVKLASRPGPDGGVEVLIETRGQGGFTILAPSAGRTHPSGDSWDVLCGSLDQVVTITGAERDQLHDLCRTLDAMPKSAPSAPAPAAPRPARPTSGEGWFDATVDDYNARTTWAEVLEGWTHHHTQGTEEFWTRPGKEPRDGASATTNANGTDRLIVFSSSVGHDLEPYDGSGQPTSYDRFSYTAHVHHGGDRTAAARHLRSQGYGPPPPAPRPVASTGGRPPSPPTPPSSTSDWPEPRPLPEGPPPAPWPRGALPAWMEAQVTNVAHSMQCAPDMPAMFGLGALSVITLGKVEVEARPGHIEPTALYLVTSLPPSEAKSPAQGAMFDVVHDFETETMGFQGKERARAQAQAKILDKKATRLEDSAANTSGDPDTLKAALDAREAADAVELPPAGRLITSDITPERLGTLMADNAERIAIVSDEAGVLHVDRYGDKKGPGRNLDVYLKAWSGRPATIDRQTAPSIQLRHPLLSIVVASQPDAWRNVLGDEELRNRGFTARFMASSPTAMAGSRTIDLELNFWDPDVAQTYNDHMGALARRLRSYQLPVRLQLSTEAQRLWSQWGQSLEHRLGLGGDLEAEAGWIGKMRDSVIRTAALLHIANDTGSDRLVGPEPMANAIRIGDYWLAHRLAGIEEVAEDLGARKLLAALVRLSKQAADGVVTRNMIGKAGARGIRKAEEVIPVLRLLEESGWVRLAGTEATADLPLAGRYKTCEGVIVHPSALRDPDATPARSCAIGATNATESEPPSPQIPLPVPEIAQSRKSLYRGFQPPPLIDSEESPGFVRDCAIPGDGDELDPALYDLYASAPDDPLGAIDLDPPEHRT